MEIGSRGSLPGSCKSACRDEPHKPWGQVMRCSDKEYFRKRGAVERALAEAAGDLKAAAVHHELAKRYEALADEAKRPTLHILTASPSAADRSELCPQQSSSANTGETRHGKSLCRASRGASLSTRVSAKGLGAELSNDKGVR
jgi:hypothetical protein